MSANYKGCLKYFSYPSAYEMDGISRGKSVNNVDSYGGKSTSMIDTCIFGHETPSAFGP